MVFVILTIFLINFLNASECPLGFLPEKGNSPGYGHTLSDKSLEECGNICKKEEKCKAFSYGNENGHCVILDDSIPTHSNEIDYQFCKKAIAGRILSQSYMQLHFMFK